MTDFEEREWFIANFSIARDSFRTAWRKDMVSVMPDGALQLQLAPAPEEADKDFFGSEVQHNDRFHYGRYEVVMQPAKGEGIISSFFVYTGPFFGDPHDEIDIEFLGRDTTKLWVARFANGERMPGRWLDLGFDAAEAPHLYAFDWSPERIIWYADGREIFRLSAEEAALPSAPGRIYMNIWAGGEGQRQWSGVAPDDAEAKALYYCVSFRPQGSQAPLCSDSFTPSGG